MCIIIIIIIIIIIMDPEPQSVQPDCFHEENTPASDRVYTQQCTAEKILSPEARNIVLYLHPKKVSLRYNYDNPGLVR